MDEFSGHQSAMEGMLNVKMSKIKQGLLQEDTAQPIRDYLMNFSSAAAVLSVSAMKGENSNTKGFIEAM